MLLKTDMVFVCERCGKQLLKWMGRCPGCGEWNGVVEKQVPMSQGPRIYGVQRDAGTIIPLNEIHDDRHQRLGTGMIELDRVLGGGIVARSVILLGGDPGIGKSTLLMQALGRMSAKTERVLYVSGEESTEQIKMRADRLGITSHGFQVLVENQLEPIFAILDEVRPSLVVLDSVQSVFTSSLDAQAGSVSQVREVTGRILDFIKKGSSACILVVHVTKDGALAGPKVLEHMVDTVVYFEGECGQSYRILRAVKNRFGPASEIGVFQMGDFGLEEVSNPSELFLSGRSEGASGSVVTSLIEGSRPVLAEIQALVTGSVPGQGRRTCLGTDPQRLTLMVAVIEKKLGLMLGDQDIFVNAVGGIRATEPASDLAMVAALLSSFNDRAITAGTVVFGEIGLTGEVRLVSSSVARINEAIRLGFRTIIAPAACSRPAHLPDGLTITGVTNIIELQRTMF